MNELFDKLIIRMVFTLFVCIILYFYKHIHRYIYPTTRGQMFNVVYPEKNYADTIHLFSRILGIGVIYSGFYFNLSDGILFSLFDFIVESIVAFAFYLVSLYVMESIVLSGFEYSVEILKNKNAAYALTCASHSIGLAYLLNQILKVSKDSFVILLMFWLLSLIILGLAHKGIHFLSQLPFNRLILQKNLCGALAYTGIFLGQGQVVSSALNQELTDLKSYVLMVVLKILLSLIILPIFIWGIKKAFNIKKDPLEKDTDPQTKSYAIGEGVYEGVLYLTASYLTSLITGQINFGTFYPIF